MPVMSHLCTPDEFRLILDFAIGIADRGLPLAVVRIAPPGDENVPEGAGIEQLRATVEQICRKTDRVTETEPGRFDVLLIDCNRSGALIFGDRLQKGLTSWRKEQGLPIGCGIACFAPSLSTPDALLAAADEARRLSFGSPENIEIYGG